MASSQDILDAGANNGLRGARLRSFGGTLCCNFIRTMNIKTLSRQLQPTGNTAQPTDQFGSDEARAGQDHYSALARMVAEISQDHSQLRAFIYEYARVKLRKELYPKFLDGAWSEVNQQVRELEDAIDKIETDFRGNAARLRSDSRPALLQGTDASLPAHQRGAQRTTTFGDEAIQARSLLLRSPAYDSSRSPIVWERDDRLANAFLGKHLRSTFWRNTQLVIAAALGLAIFAAINTQSVLNRLGTYKLAWVNADNKIDKERNVPATDAAALPTSNQPNRLHASDLPIPADYGAFAVVNGKLTELQPLPIKVPDPRVAISAAISVPSQTHFPTGQSQFVIFRRDLANNAPDRVAVRVMAQVMRVLTFDATGRPKTTDDGKSWVIRDKAYQMRVAPFGDNPEMIVIRSDPADFVFPAGRYALVLKGVGYDFTVDGPVTDPAHCLERTDALNAPIYSECRKP